MSVKVASIYAELSVQDKMTSALQTAKGGLSNFAGGLKDGLLGLAGFASAAALGGIAVQKFTQMIKDSVRIAAEAETGMARLNATLIATGRGSEISASQIDKIAVSLMGISTFDDESIVNAYNTLMKFDNVPTSKMEDVVKAAMNMSAALGGDLTSNAEMIGRVLETGLIPRTWAFDSALKEQVRTMIAAGDSGGALTLVMDELNKRYGGQAAAQLNTYAGAAERVRVAWAEVLESNGKGYLQDAKNFNNWLANFLMGAAKYSDATHKFSTTGPASTYAAMLNYAEALEIAAREARVLIDQEEDLIRVGNTFVGVINNQDGSMRRLGNTFEGLTPELDALADAAKKAQDAMIDQTAWEVMYTGAKDAAERSQQEFDMLGRGIQGISDKGAEVWEQFLRASGELDIPAMEAFVRVQMKIAEVNRLIAAGASFNVIINYLMGVDETRLGSWNDRVTSEPAGGGDGWERYGPNTTRGKTGGWWRHLDPDGTYSFEEHASGGFPTPGQWTLVGDMPGGGLTPYSELISPAGEIIPADKTRALLSMGLRNVRSAADGESGFLHGRTAPETQRPGPSLFYRNALNTPAGTDPASYASYNAALAAYNGDASGFTPQAQAAVIQSAVAQAVAQASAPTVNSAASISSAALKISDSGERTATATQQQAQQNNQGNAAIIARLQAIENLLAQNFQSMPKAWAAAQARSVPV